jgi:hypothetical protein
LYSSKTAVFLICIQDDASLRQEILINKTIYLSSFVFCLLLYMDTHRASFITTEIVSTHTNILSTCINIPLRLYSFLYKFYDVVVEHFFCNRNFETQPCKAFYSYQLLFIVYFNKSKICAALCDSIFELFIL